MECEYCEAKRCIKCLKITDTTYKSLGDRPDFPWFCDKCIGKAMKCIREEREIEKRCGDFLEGFRQEVNTKLDNMQAEIEVIRATVQEQSCKSDLTKKPDDSVVNQVMNDVRDRITRDKNIVIFNLPESSSILKDEIAKEDKEHFKKICEITLGTCDVEVSTRRLGKRVIDTPAQSDAAAEPHGSTMTEERSDLCLFLSQTRRPNRR